MSRVGFEPMIPVFERAKAVHALDRAVTVIGSFLYVTILLLPYFPYCEANKNLRGHLAVCVSVCLYSYSP
jgi:hypothetical protein